MKVLVIGGTRFIGRYIVNELLRKGHKIIIYHRGRNECEFIQKVEHMHGDRRDYTKFKKDMAKLSPDGVVDVIPLYPRDSKAIVDSFHGRIRSLVHISSGGVYGFRAFIPFKEEEQNLIDEARYPYAYSKRLCEQIIIESQRLYEIPCVILRLPAVYGPYDYSSREWFIIKRILNKRRHIIIPDGGFTLVHQFYVEDVAKAVAMALENPPTKICVYNIGHEQILNLKQITRLIGKLMNYKWEEVKIPSELIPYKNPFLFRGNLVFSTSKIKQELGFKETFSIEQGMRRTIDWFCKNPPPQEDEMHNVLFNYELEDRIIQEYSNFVTHSQQSFFKKIKIREGSEDNR